METIAIKNSFPLRFLPKIVYFLMAKLGLTINICLFDIRHDCENNDQTIGAGEDWRLQSPVESSGLPPRILKGEAETGRVRGRRDPG